MRRPGPVSPGGRAATVAVLVAAAIVATLPAGRAGAHPPVSLVKDAAGAVYFSDLVQVWRIAPDGQVTLAVPRVHTHELEIDDDGNLYGEHLWYNGDAAGTWAHRIWCRTPDGTVADVVSARAGFRTDRSFVRDAAGARYWAEAAYGGMVIRKRPATGPAVTLVPVGTIREVGWLTVTPDGTLFLIERGDVKRVTADGRVTTVVPRLSSRTRPPAAVIERHYHMGLWTAGDSTVFVAVPGERVVMRIDRAGRTRVAARSPEPWAPAGGLLDDDGRLWLLEYDPANAVRVRRLDRDGGEALFRSPG